MCRAMNPTTVWVISSSYVPMGGIDTPRYSRPWTAICAIPCLLVPHPRPARELCLCLQTHLGPRLLHMQIDEDDVAALLDRLVAAELPERRGLDAWASLLQAHATLMRRLESDLERETGLALADFDVLAQLANAGGELRMTELAARALISRSGMTRRVARLVDERLVRRVDADADGRGVVVALTDAGVARLLETAPV